ncbi:hypothetical protein JGH11_04645 [Dysgonomonas sp. Marseille-P4677]|uniref:hypothetical protein n=1 Tax=Dysgonomonas sp. Marseille-P4677 TaxID=2364790 RepID=UPI001913822A|nr:hypothetical protein [Dysgonomonas sp. Marseille-P4677]MBK5720156.1 hypothetical protein [Dysgonomonas sp. Marseille-P4677]
MITDVTYPRKHCFTGNPIIIKVMANTADDINLIMEVESEPEITLSITPYTPKTQFLSEGEFDVSDILNTYFESSKGSITSLVNNFRIHYRITIDGYSGGIFEGYAYRGGVSNKNYTLLKSWGLDMFDYRLNSLEKRQFLFTTRTNHNSIRLRERELYPFVFLHPGNPISFISSNGRVITLPSKVKDSVCSMNIETIRNMFVSLYNELPAFIAVHVDGKSIFNITITPSQIAEEHVVLRFRNSLGAYEQIEITGSSLFTSQFSEERTWLTPHQDGYYEELRDRLASKEGVKVETGYKNKDEIALLKDLLKSDEIYYIDSGISYNEVNNRCHVTAEKFELLKVNTTPKSIALTIRFATEDIYESPDIVLEYSTATFQNLTAPGSPEIEADGFIYDDDYPFYAE